jgi:uncharacterized protein (TIGR02594 family)
MQTPSWLTLAYEELGQKEIAGKPANPRIVEYLHATGLSESYASSDETAWCAAFVSWVMVQAGYQSLHSAWANAWQGYGEKLSHPAYGAVACFDRHVAFYIGETATHVRVLGGNQSNAVTEASFPKSRLVCYRWPVGAPAAPEPPASERKATFEAAHAFTKPNEGGFSNHENDGGGPTNHGISLRTLTKWRGYPCSADDMRSLSFTEAVQIFRANYWNPYYERLSQPKATAIFDWGVLHGYRSAQSDAQIVANACGASIAVDGQIGPKSVAAMNGISDRLFCQTFAGAMNRTFAAIIAGDSTQKVFEKGWAARAKRVAALADPPVAARVWQAFKSRL